MNCSRKTGASQKLINRLVKKIFLCGSKNKIEIPFIRIKTLKKKENYASHFGKERQLFNRIFFGFVGFFHRFILHAF